MMKKLLSIFVLLLVSVVTFSQDSFDLEKLLTQKPSPPKLVNDFTNTLTPDQKQALEINWLPLMTAHQHKLLLLLSHH